MGYTIGRRIPRHIRPGDYVAMCDQCGFHYYRSQLVKKPGGALLCLGPGTVNDAKGADAYELSQGNAEGAAEHARRKRPQTKPSGGNYDDDI